MIKTKPKEKGSDSRGERLIRSQSGKVSLEERANTGGNRGERQGSDRREVQSKPIKEGGGGVFSEYVIYSTPHE